MTAPLGVREDMTTNNNVEHAGFHTMYTASVHCDRWSSRWYV